MPFSASPSGSCLPLPWLMMWSAMAGDSQIIVAESITAPEADDLQAFNAPRQATSAVRNDNPARYFETMQHPSSHDLSSNPVGMHHVTRHQTRTLGSQRYAADAAVWYSSHTMPLLLAPVNKNPPECTG